MINNNAIMKLLKRIIYAALLLALAVRCYAADPVSDTLQKGLFEEEANHNLEAAIQAYQSVLNLGNDQRKMMATAVFRLGECYRKQGKNAEAIAQYERVLRDYSDQAVLIKFSRQNLASLGAGERVSTNAVSAIPATNVEAGEVQRIKAMIKDSPDLINVAGPTGSTPLGDAASKCYLTVAEFLLSNHADIEEKGRNGTTPLHQAVANGHKAMVELLLAHHANVNARASGGETPLDLAAQKGFKAVAEVLLANKAEINSQDNESWTPLHKAARNGLKAMSEFLLASGADVNARYKTGGTPLFEAVKYGHLAPAELLLGHKADPNLSDGAWSPLFKAVAEGRLEMARLLLEHGADAKARMQNYEDRQQRPNRQGNVMFMGPEFRQNVTLLHVAVSLNQKAMVELLLKFHADVNGADANGATPLLYAVGLSQTPIAEVLLANGADVNRRGDFEIAVGADNYRQVEPLKIAVFRGQTEMVALLLRCKADVNVTNEKNQTPLRAAVDYGRKDMVEMLLHANADPNTADADNHYTPLHVAVMNRQNDIVALLLEHGAQANVLDYSGNTPLAYAKTQRPGQSYGYSPEIVRMLHEHGAIDDLQRRSFVTANREEHNYTERLFEKDTNRYNHFTLYEAIAQAYNATKRNPGNTPLPPAGGAQSALAFPDFARVKISRLTAKEGETKEIKMNLDVAFSSGDISKNIGLDWGDVVEIPEQDHPVNMGWGGLSEQAYDTLQRCLTRKVELVVKGQTNSITLKPNLVQTRSRLATAPFAVEFYQPGMAPQPLKEMSSFWLYQVVLGSGVLRSSSDVAHVKVRRADPTTKEARELVFNLEKSDPRNDLWLRDGDVIEIPEK
jgi:ankyrin repeat protein